VNGVRFPDGWAIESLQKTHNRRSFHSGNDEVDGWLKQSALQSQNKHLSATKVLLDDQRNLIGYYSLATSQVSFSDLPLEIVKSLPSRQLPVAVLAWLGLDSKNHGKGLGKRLLATALRDCFEASQTFPFIAVLLDCIDPSAKTFYKQFDFLEMPGYPMKLFLSFQSLEKLMQVH